MWSIEKLGIDSVKKRIDMLKKNSFFFTRTTVCGGIILVNKEIKLI